MTITKFWSRTKLKKIMNKNIKEDSRIGHPLFISVYLYSFRTKN